ncbi:MAG: hypothetical protein H0T46_03125 [Deltaproteobacteria bacterium]|nr:hypothetical protein [Deltaproteobacteria bacterium]
MTFLPGRVTCPLAGVGNRPADASNRLAVDDPATEVTVDRAAGRITIADDRACAQKTVLADLVWLAQGIDEAGRATPFTIHAEITKLGHAFSIDIHTHEPSKLPRARLAYEPFEIDAVDGDRRTMLLNLKKLAFVASHNPLARRLSGALTTTRDHLPAHQDPAAPGYRVIDRSIGIGALGRGLMLVRVRIASLAASNAPLIARGSLADMLRDGSWELSIEALTDRWLPELVQRDLFLFQMSDVPLLAPVARGGLRAGQTLGFRTIAGSGEIRLDDATAPFPAALDASRAYLEYHMLGSLIAEAVAR